MGALHVVVLTVPSQGHVNGAMDLAKRLASFDVSVTFACTEACIESMKRGGFDAEGLPLRLHGLPDGLQPHEKSSDFVVANAVDDVHMFIRVTQSMGPSLQDMLSKFEEEGRGAACVIYDFTLWWVGQLCKELRVPAYIFQPLSASFCLYIVHIPSLVSQGRLPLRPGVTDVEDDSNNFKIPGLPDLHVSEVPDISWEPNAACPFWYVLQCASRWRDASGMLLNTVYELEKGAIDELLAMAPEMDIKAVGPLLPPGFLRGGSAAADPRNGMSADVQRCMEWLDEQAPASVLYAAFGTVGCLSEEQTKELAMGLEASQQRFVWVVRIPEKQQPDEDRRRRLLPSGFEERLQGTGVVLWERAPQRQILAHPAVGAFLTHNGWNSTLESLCRGVPMLCLPVFADQPMNAKWVDDVVHTGKLMRKVDNKSGLVSKEEVACMARNILTTPTPLRASAIQTRDVACHAALGGSSLHNLQDFVQMLAGHSS